MLISQADRVDEELSQWLGEAVQNEFDLCPQLFRFEFIAISLENRVGCVENSVDNVKITCAEPK